ncbi:ATP-binding cassette domain-containing protein [Paenibacillus sp. N1-5-1-14]|uniref:ABC transporter ATP-binding protein n=1 Tax=Paenibacillus radicibacter TaxID=2972488 RepID=UPI002159B47D|nr:ATP-binding cassette domain-containing protein [Paenibacillus radicibacter]MCR8641692.1 ATP-binding cassette domain-containing protein [Paenibacillus radicibacter]
MAIKMNEIIKTFHIGGTTYTALKGIDLHIHEGEFVTVIGKSGSGKSTLINMMTGIDVPTSGKIQIAGTDLSQIKKRHLSQWRGRHLGIIFQFFQLLPTLSLLENVMLPMDFCGVYGVRERKRKAMELLDQVGMLNHMNKLPSAVSGGQQQRVAIARALANNPSILIADEPTGSLDSKTAESVFQLFEHLVEQGKTIVMVTHDNDLASRVKRSVVMVDGQIVNEYVMQALPNLNVDQLTHLIPQLQTIDYEPGTVIIREGDVADSAYIITQGEVEVYLNHPGGQQILVNRLGKGQYFGEIALIQGGTRTATVRAAGDQQVMLRKLDRTLFQELINSSELTRDEIERITHQRLTELFRVEEGQ